MKTVYKNTKNLFNNLLSIYYNDYINILDKEKKKMGEKYNPSNLLIKCLTFIESKKEDKETNKSQAAETIAERVKLRKQKSNDDDSDEFIDISDMPPRWWRSKRRKKIKNHDSKQVINPTSTVFSTNKSWKQFIQIKK